MKISKNGQRKNQITHMIYPWILCAAGYLISLLLLCNPYEIRIYPFWLIGIVLIANFVNGQLSLVLCYSCIVIAHAIHAFDLDTLLMHVLLGSMICHLAPCLTKLQQLMYAILLVVTMNVSFWLAMNGFVMEGAFDQVILYMLLADLLILIFAFLFKQLLSPMVLKMKIASIEMKSYKLMKEQLASSQLSVTNHENDKEVDRSNQLQEGILGDEAGADLRD